jgi:dTDP-4-amino-4,6-dideoxygalactose transaminase
MIRCDNRTASWSDLAAALLPRRGPALWNDPACVPVHSGKAALNHVLSYLRSVKILQNKNSKILTPPWLGYWVYDAMRPHGFPVLHDDPDVKVAVVYHQYGFPQDLDEIKDHCARRGIVFIEDCAHALGASYKGRPIGSDGLAGIFSLSKFYPSQIGGAVRSDEAALRAYVARLEEAGSAALGVFSFGVKLILQHNAFATRDNAIALRLNELAYAGYPYSRRLQLAGSLCSVGGVRDELDLRRRNYRLYRELLPDHEELQALEEDAIPFVLPLMHPRREALERMAAAMRQIGVNTGIYSFDVNRNLFHARYVPSLWLPVHGAIGEDLVARLAEAVRREL